MSHEPSSRAVTNPSEGVDVDAAALLDRLLEQARPSLVATLGFADLLRDPGLDGRGRDALLDRLGAAGRRIVRMCDTVAELRRITASATPPHADRQCDLLSVLERLLGERRACISAAGLRVSVRSEAAVPSAFVVDADRVRLAIAAVLEDAMASLTGGSLDLRIGFDPPAPEAAGDGRLRIEIVAGGAEPAADPVPAEAGIAADDPGTANGLGIMIARVALGRIGGEVTGRRTERPGLRIRLLVPASPASDDRLRIDQGMPPESGTARDPAAGSPLEGLQVLVAEGQPEPRWLLRAVLERSGAQVEEAADGPGLLEAITRGPVGVLLFSADLPGCDPRDLIGGLRHQGLGCPVIVMAAADPGAVGDAWLPTPVDPAAMLQACARWRGRRHESPPGSRD